MIRQVIYALSLLLLALNANADDPQPPTPASADASRWSLLIPAVVLHGITPDGDSAQSMPHKLTANGQWVQTPGFGIEFEGKESLDVVLAAFKDCYDHPAGTFQIGQFLRLGESTRIGYTLGIYMRQAPISCSSVSSQTQSGHGRSAQMVTSTSTECSELDDLPLKYVVKIGGGTADIIPLPFLNFSTALIKTQHLELDFKVMSNFILNEFGLSLPF